MPRPCRHDGHSECMGVPRAQCPCPTCWAYHNDPRYKALWDGRPVPAPAGVAPEADWPRRVRLLARLRREGEIGAGDTAHRLLAGAGGERLAWLYRKLTGKDCGCERRREKLNALYPYERP